MVAGMILQAPPQLTCFSSSAPVSTARIANLAASNEASEAWQSWIDGWKHVVLKTPEECNVFFCF